jgi:hypothetical protein
MKIDQDRKKQYFEEIKTQSQKNALKKKTEKNFEKV